MAYYLVIQKKQGEYQTLDICSLKNFEKSSKFKTGYSLEEIDNFTSKYDSELDLKNYLYDKGIIDLGDITKDITIKQKIKGQYKTVRYGLAYGDTRKYLDEQYLVHFILRLRNDNEFLEKLVSNYRNSFSGKVQISEITNYISSSFNINIYKSLNEFCIREIFKLDDEGNVTLKYKSLHDLAMFVYNYVTKKEKKELGISSDLESIQRKKELLTLQKSKLLCDKEEKATKVKKLTKKEIEKQPIEGQISFFD